VLEELYQEAILDHGRKPRNFGRLEGETHTAEGYNPLCGDRVRLALRVADGQVMEARFDGVGCAISQASASLMTLSVAGLGVADAQALSETFRRLLTEGGDAEGIGELECLLGVRNFPNRVKCATLAWHALASALEDGAQVKTE
jgi:nitrogen fixation NifU-like protein